MRILHIIDSLSMGGAENVLVGLSAEQKRLGHDVVVVPLVCPDQTPLRSKIENEGITVAPIKMKGSVYDIRLVCKLARIMGQYDIVHVHLFPALYWAAFAKRISRCHVPMVFTEHSTNNKRRKNAVLHFVDHIVYKRGYKMIVACAEKVQDSFRHAFPDISHVCYVNNGVNTQIYQEATPYQKKELINCEGEPFIVTMVARFMPMKRQDTVVEALAILPNKIHAVFVGGEKEDEGLLRVQRLAVEKGVADRVHFLYIRTDVPRILKTSDVVVMASDYEGLSLSSIEGMASGKPFIATNVDGLREVVGGAGLLFANGDSETLASLVNRLTVDKEFYIDVAKKCQSRSASYDVKTMTKSYISVYNKVSV